MLREVYESAGYQVLGVAPTGRAARELTEEAGVAARTLDRLLIDLEQLGDELPQGCVLILDEAGMAATRASARVLQAAEQAGAKVIAIGDPGQLASVQAGGWLGAVGRELGALRLTEVMRQRDPAERRALGALHDRLPRHYLDWAEQAGRIETFSDPAGACEQALSEWQRAIAAVGPAAGGDDRQGQRHSRSAEHAQPESFGGLSGCSARSAPTAPSRWRSATA